MDLSENIKNEFEDITQSNTSDKPAKKLNKITKIGILTSLDEFAQNSTLHGLRFIVDRTLNYVEKLFWLIVVIVGIVMCSFLIHNMWVKWQSSPIIITMNENLVPVDSVYYPSLTICPQIKIKKNSYDFETERNNYEEVMWNGYNETPSLKIRLSKVADIAYMCDADVWAGVMNFPLPYHTFNIDHIRNVALDFEDIFKTCEWNTNSIPCDTLYQKVITREGVCFTMNALNADEIIRDETLRNELYLPNKRYRQNFNTSIYPFKGSVNDASAEFAMTLKEYFDYDDKSCRRYSTGFYVYLQDPADMPQATIHSYVVKPNQIVSLALKLDSVSTSEDLKSYSIQTRQCYFPDEPYLKFFRTYTESNCRLECIANYTKTLCGCATFYMPRVNATPICESSEMFCVEIAEILLYGYISKPNVNLLKEMYPYLNKYTDQFLITQGREFVDACKCLPTCKTVNYDADVMEMDYDFEYYFNSFCNRLETCDTYNESYKYAKIEWIFKRHSFVGMTRTSIFGITDFIAQCGGLLGLFLGFSFLTVVEIIYYVTLRLGCIIRREKLSNTLNERDPTV